MNIILRWIRSAVRPFRKKRTMPWQLETMEQKFTAIYRSNAWKDPTSVSGPGSTLRETAAVRRQLPALVEQLGIRSILDIPCGDFNWMREVSLGIDKYIGADVVEEIVTANRRQFASDRCTFVKLDVTHDRLPAVDLVLCRDCLVHFSFADIFLALQNIARSRPQYLLTTTFPETQHNADIATGQWRRLNLQRPPFSLPDPLKIISEECPLEGFADKSLGLYSLHCLGYSLPPRRD